MRKTTLDLLAECKWELEETKANKDYYEFKYETLSKWLKKNNKGKWQLAMDYITKEENKNKDNQELIKK